MSINRKFKAWDAYCDFYRQVSRDTDAGFQAMFGEKFALAYEEQMRRMKVLK